MFRARPYVQNRYRNEEVDLQPGGSTIVVTTPSDNPFEDERDIEVLTQQSGGMEGGPDPKMVSKKVHTKINQHKSIARGKVHAVRTIGPAHMPLRHGGFMPGMGYLGDESDDFAAMTAAQDTQFLPAIQANPGAMVVTPAIPAASTPSGPGFMSALTQGLTAASKVANPLLAAQTAKNNAAAAAAAVKPPGSPSSIGTSVMKYMPYIAGGLGVLLVLKLVFGGSSSRPVVLATNPRRR